MTEAAVSLRDVSHTFGATPVLHDIGLEIAAASFTASGKRCP